MSTKSSFREALERPVGGTDTSPVLSDFVVVRIIVSAKQIRQPIDVATTLRHHGMSLRKATDTLNRLAKGERVSLEMRSDPAALIADLSKVGVDAISIKTPNPDVKQIRER